MKLNLFAYLTEEAQTKSEAMYARQFSLCQWYSDEKEQRKKAEFYVQLWHETEIGETFVMHLH